MDSLNLLALAVALAMDAFAVAVAAGLAIKLLTKRHVFRLAFHFGLFQALMPTLGWTAGFALHRIIAAFDHWIAFGLLAFVGGKMIRDAFFGAEETLDASRDPTSGWSLVVLSVATSIDACRSFPWSHWFDNPGTGSGYRDCGRRIHYFRHVYRAADRYQVGKTS